MSVMLFWFSICSCTLYYQWILEYEKKILFKFCLSKLFKLLSRTLIPWLMYNLPKKKISYLSITAGVACTYVGQPFDTIKVKMQTYPQLYKGSMHCLRDTMRREGVRGLFEGSVPALAAICGESAVLFMCYGLCQKAVCRAVGVKKETELTSLQKAMSGSCASFFSSLVLCPTELVKCRMQAMSEVISVSDTITKKM